MVLQVYLFFLSPLALQTPVEDVPQCFAPFRGMLLAGVGNRLRLYALGKKRLLRKCEYKVRPITLNNTN